MKKFYYLMSVFIFAGFISCKNENKKTEDSSTNVPVAVSSETTPEYKKINVKKVEANPNDMQSVSRLLDETEKHDIDVVNWPDQYPSKPEVSFSIAHNGDNILLKYFVHENEILGNVTQDNGEVWTDSAVEFFLMFGNDYYYNAEFNCIGTALLGHKATGDNDIEHASPEIMKSIKRLASLGTEKRNKETGDFHWTLTVAIPKTAYWQDSIDTFSGLKALGNFFKCGDNLTTPHYLSWTEIDTPNPSFHQPDFFGELEFE